MREIQKAQVHRFRDHVAVWFEGAETVYLTAEQARLVARQMTACAHDTETSKFSESNFGTWNLPAPKPRRSTNDERVGKRVEIAPHFDLWMSGARFGTVSAVIRQSGKQDVLCLKMDHPQVKRTVRVRADDVTFR